MLKKIILTIWVFTALTLGPASGEVTDVQSFLKGKIDAARSVLETQGLPDPEKRDRVIQIIMPVFNLPLMTKLAEGKAHWTRLSSAQREAFTQAFTKKLQKTYISSVMGYTDVAVAYGKTVQKGNKAYIPIDLTSSDGTVNTLYKLHHAKDTWRIYDVEIEDVSIVKSYHSQINQILTTGTFDDLMQKMEND